MTTVLRWMSLPNNRTAPASRDHDLSSISGSATQTFYDDGTHGDVTAADNTFSYSATVPLGSSAGGLSLPVTIGDAQSRTGSTNIALTVAPEGGLSVVAAGPPATVDVTASTVLAVIVPRAGPELDVVTADRPASAARYAGTAR